MAAGPEDAAPFTLLARECARAGAQWSMGAFGAIEGFTTEGATTTLDRPGSRAAVTDRGGLRLDDVPGLVPVAFEMLSSDRTMWNHAVALCLPVGKAEYPGPATVMELGLDRDALRAEDRDGILFDLGLPTRQARICLRTQEDGLIAALRGGAGKTFAAAAAPWLPLLRPGRHQRIALSRIGRIEVFPHGAAPDGAGLDAIFPGLSLPLLASGRTHAATSPIPRDLMPCGYLFPPHPARHRPGEPIAFDMARHAAFQVLLRRFGPPALVALKARVEAALDAGEPPDRLAPPAGRFEAACLRVTLRQRNRIDPSPLLDAWRDRFDPPRGGRTGPGARA